jgi:hypothetical protein
VLISGSANWRQSIPTSLSKPIMVFNVPLNADA